MSVRYSTTDVWYSLPFTLLANESKLPEHDDLFYWYKENFVTFSGKAYELGCEN